MIGLAIMTATSETQSILTDSLDSLNEKQRRIYEYLTKNADTKTYFKSREIAEALGLNAKEVGVNMTGILEADGPLTVEKWGYSSSTTWMVNHDQV